MDEDGVVIERGERPEWSRRFVSSTWHHPWRWAAPLAAVLVTPAAIGSANLIVIILVAAATFASRSLRVGVVSWISCAVAFSGADRGAQWPGSRVISAQKANTANAFSLDGLALSTANLYSAVQPFGTPE